MHPAHTFDVTAVAFETASSTPCDVLTHAGVTIGGKQHALYSPSVRRSCKGLVVPTSGLQLKVGTVPQR